MNWSQARRTERQTAIRAVLSFLPYLLLCTPIGWLPPLLFFAALDGLLGTRFALSPWPWLAEPITMLLGVYLFLQYLRWTTRTDVRTALVRLEQGFAGEGDRASRPARPEEKWALDSVFYGFLQVTFGLYVMLGVIYWVVSGWLTVSRGYSSPELVAWWAFGFSLLTLLGGICLMVLFYRQFRATVRALALQLVMYGALKRAGDDAAVHPFDWTPLGSR